MVTLTGGFRPQFKEKVKNFCSENDLQIVYLKNMGNCYSYTIAGNTDDRLIEYIDKLEDERREIRNNKSFWWRLWN